MVKRFIIMAGICLIPLLNLQAQNYSFNGSMSEQVLYNFLDRSITMSGQSAVEGVTLLTETERQENIDMLIDIGAKFIGRIGHWWESGWGQNKLDQIIAKCSTNVAELKARDPDIICQAAIFEYVSGTVETFDLPQDVLDAFNQNGNPRKFDYDGMLYPGPASQYQIYGRTMTEDERTWIPDITQVETQMWFYYLATRFIDIGVEAIHWGQAEIMNRRDMNNGHAAWWGLLSMVRAYAASKNRGVILCDAHLPSGGIYFDPNPNNPLPETQRQLVFDFHSMPIGFEEAPGCNGTIQPVKLQKYPDKHLYGRSKGGMNPLGWYTTSNNFLGELDNGGVGSSQGCNGGPAWFLYGWDEISWFANQPQSYRNDVLEYAWYKAKCLDPKAHLEMPGSRVYWINQSTRQNYRCNTGQFNAEATIKSIWAGNFDQDDWSHENFTNTQVAGPPNPPNALSDLILVGKDKMYYIATDGTIHGYVKYGGTWSTVSPSWAASMSGQTPIANQILAGGDLVASPDGQRLFYRGIDGYLHGFTIVDKWTYNYDSYSGLTSKLKQQNLTMLTSLVPHGNDRLYYIGREGKSNHNRVHAFVKYAGSWTTNSPSWSAHANGTNINSQTQAAGDLALSPDGKTLVYRGTDGFMRGYDVQSFWSYTYNSWSGLQSKMQTQNIRVDAELTFSGNNAIYYIARELSSGGALRIHAYVEYAGSWTTTSPSHASSNVSVTKQQTALGELAVSPSGNRIMYIGSDYQLYGFDVNNIWSYSYIDPTINVPLTGYLSNSLTMPNDNEVYYVSFPYGYFNKDIQLYRYGAGPCTNPEIYDVEPNHNPNGKKGTEPGALVHEEVMTEFGLNIWPNPAQQEVTLRLNAGAKQATIRILDIQGRTVLKTGTVSLENNQWQQKLDLSQLRPGLYMVNATAGARSWTKKLIVR